MRKYSDKKKLMFVTGEDFYFLTYNILLFLKELKCDGESRKFKDYRKLAFLLDFISDRDLVKILKKNEGVGRILNDIDRKAIVGAWSNGIVRVKLLARLLYALEQRELIGIEKDSVRKSVTVWYKKNEKTNKFFKENVFDSEKDNAKAVIKLIKGISNISFEKLEEKLFHNYGINTHGIPVN